jgi:broad specificity phosphatase PhoE
MLIVVRHGRTEANRDRRLLGRLDPGLDEVGRSQADALARHIGPVDRIVSSPLVRARETAAAWGAPVEIDERWTELDYGELDGVELAAVDPDLWRAWRSDLEFVPAGGESIGDLGRRVRSACEALRDDSVDGDVVVVSHVSPIKAAVAWALGVSDDIAWRMFVAPAAITRIAVSHTGTSLRGFNHVDHLDAAE